MIDRKSTYTKPTIKYSDNTKLIDYLSENCTDKEYHKAMAKLDKFEIIVKD